MTKQELTNLILTGLNVEQFELGGLMARCLEHNIAYDLSEKHGLISFPHLNNHYLVIIDTVKDW